MNYESQNVYFITGFLWIALNIVFDKSIFYALVFTVAEFKEFERLFKFKLRFKNGWFHLKLYKMFQDLSRRLI